MNSTHHVKTDYGTGKKKLGVYTLGIILCVILTIIPFAAVMYPVFTRGVTFIILYSAAVLQLIVQVSCFLRLNTQTEQSRINLMSFIFSIVILAVIIGGSLWIMWNLDYNMM